VERDRPLTPKRDRPFTPQIAPSQKKIALNAGFAERAIVLGTGYVNADGVVRRLNKLRRESQAPVGKFLLHQS
jgi:hypothetical protein